MGDVPSVRLTTSAHAPPPPPDEVDDPSRASAASTTAVGRHRSRQEVYEGAMFVESSDSDGEHTLQQVVRVDRKRKRVDTVIVGSDGEGGGVELEWMYGDVLTRVRRYREGEYVE